MPLHYRGLTLSTNVHLEPPSQVYSNSESFHLEASCLLVNPSPVLRGTSRTAMGGVNEVLSLPGAFVQPRASFYLQAALYTLTLGD